MSSQVRGEWEHWAAGFGKMWPMGRKVGVPDWGKAGQTEGEGKRSWRIHENAVGS